MTEKEFLIEGLIITFNPDERLLLSFENVQKVAKHVVIVDNDSIDKSFIDQLKNKFNKNSLTVLELPNNLGIAGALNYGVKYIKDNFITEYILTLDQDTIIVANDIDTVIYEVNQRFDNVGLIALGTNKTKKSIAYREVKTMITSGNLVRAEVFNSLKFREEFFIDQVDLDFDYELRKLGYKIILVDGYLIDHRLGTRLGNLPHEPLFRIYYIIRNSTVLLIERKLNLNSYIYQIMYWSPSSILNDGFSKYCKILITGIFDGLFRRLGKK